MKSNNSFALVALAFLFLLGLTQNGYGQDLPNEKKANGINVMVTQSPQIIVGLERVTHNRCFGDQKGAISITARGGYPPYKYYWDNGDTTQNIAGLKAGAYKVAVYDKFSCSDTLEVEIEEPYELKGEVARVRDILCYGYNHGAIDIAITGGVAPYSFKWSNDSTTEDLTGITSGRYSALITDANGCQDIVTADVLETPLIIRTVDDLTNIKCYGDSTGGIEISVSGGVPPYSYQWNNGSAEKDLKNLRAGEYEVLVKDAEGCTEVSLVKVKEPDPLTIEFDELRNLRCYDDGGGVININVTGGVVPYKYKWNNGASTQDLIGIPAGMYSVEVVDKNACRASTSANITEPPALNIALVKSQNISYADGNDGLIEVDVSGGVPPYKYKWNNGSEIGSISSLVSGSYTLRATDASGCARILNVALTQPQPLQVKLTHSKDILCYGENTGEIGISVMGGVPPYQFLWSHGAVQQNIAGLKAGKYAVTVTDANKHSQTIGHTLTEPPLFEYEIASIDNIQCHSNQSGAIDLEVKGGVLPYRYRWSAGQATQDLKDIAAGEYSVKITDANQCELNATAQVLQPDEMILEIASVDEIKCFGQNTGAIHVRINGGVAPYSFNWNTGATTQNLSSLPAGKYSLTATDANGCMKELETEISQPQLLTVEEERLTHIDCFANHTGAVSVNVNGGVEPYSFQWNTGQAVKDISGLKKGDYTLQVTDANGCVNTFNRTIAEPEKLVKSIADITNILCYGEAKGAVNINVEGGIQPYSYSWSNGAITKNLVNVKAGSYKVAIVDANGCSDSLTAVVEQNSLLTSTASVVNIKCHGDTSGVIDLSVTGGVAPYSYKWSNGIIAEDLVNIPAGAYSVTIADAKGCIRIHDATVVEPTKFLAGLASEKDILCHGDHSGNIAIRTSGGVKPYKFVWNNGDTTQNLSGIPAGSYALNATDANGCVQVVKTTLQQPPAIEHAVKSISNLFCNGDNSGSIDIAVSGGVGPYVYSWNNGSSSPVLNNVAAGKYALQIKDANGCTKSLEAEITQPEPLVLQLDTIIHVLCHGEEKGSVAVSIEGGVKPYKFSWSNGAESQNLANVSAGTYTLAVVDANGCSRFLSASVKQPEPLVADFERIKQLACYGDANGEIMITTTGGAKPYTFKWNNGASSQNLANLVAGSYSVDIVDKNGCGQQLATVIEQPKKLESKLLTASDITCYDGSDGLIDIAVKGGVAPYSYAWNNSASSQDLNDIKAGSYSVRIVDHNGCRDSLLNISIKQPDLLIAKVVRVKPLLKYGRNDGAIDINVTGGVKPYHYSWTNGAVTQNLASIPGGNYAVKIKDGNGCISIVDTVVNQPLPLTLSIASILDIKCYNDKSGNIEVNVEGGAPPYVYQWSNGATTQNISNVPAGDYSLRVSDSNGNTEVLSARIAQPSELTIKETASENVLCNSESSGSVNVAVTGGIAPYQFLWNNGAETKDLAGLSAGSYSLTVTDSYGCRSIFEKTIAQPEAFVAGIASISHVDCMGESKGAIELAVSGGVTPYSYSWSNGVKAKDLRNARAGSYTVAITDANGCKRMLDGIISEPPALTAGIASISNNLCSGDRKGTIAVDAKGGTEPYKFSWNTGDTTQNLTSVASGDYIVKIVDSKGCSREVSTTVKEPRLLVASLIETGDVKCYGELQGSLKINVEGGVAPYSYLWSNGEKTKNLRDIPAGDYQLTVSDANGCSTILSATINQPPTLAVNLDAVQHVKCYGDGAGMIDVNVEGGVFPYTYSWSNGATSEDLVNAMSGVYMVNVKDANGCVQSLSATIEQPQRLVITAESIDNLKCAGEATGMIKTNVEGGLAPYKYLWSNGDTNPEAKNLQAGDYRVMVTDSNNCTAIYNAEITQPPALVRAIDAISDIRCFGDNTGSITVSVMGGTLPYEFLWNNGATTKDLKGVTAGNYRLTITEGNGCQSQLEASIEEPPPFNAAVTNVEHVKCFGEMTGRIAVDVTGGSLPYRFSWSNGEITQNVDSLPADSYALMIADGNGCIRTIHAEVTEPPLLSLKIDSVKNVKCCGDNSGAIYITVEGGVAPYDYLWSNGAATQDIENLVLGVYTVVATDANNCVISTADNTTLYEQIVSQGMFTTRDINFDVSKSIIKPESFSTINRIASFMKEHAELSFRIDGHTDSDGTEIFNQRLSEERAAAIKEALIKFGIRENRLVTKGWGESLPVVPNTSSENKALNRRVEFIALTGTLDGTLIENQIREIRGIQEVQ